MATDVVTESSPALETLSSEQLTEWRKTGNLPKIEESAPSASPATATSAAEEAGTATESGTVTDPQDKKPKSEAEKRILELLAKAKAAEDRAEKAEARAKAAEGKTEPTDVKPAPSTGKSESKRPVKPKLLDFDTIELHEAAMDKYHDELETYYESKAKASAESVVAEAEKTRKDEQAKAESAKVREQQESQWAEKVQTAAKKHADYKDKAQLVIDKFTGSKEAEAQSQHIDAYIMRSDHGAELVYHLGANPAELDRILALDPYAQIEALVEMKGKLVSKPAIKIPAAPAPVTEVAGRATAADDPVEDAVAKGDFARYSREQNAKDLKRSKG